MAALALAWSGGAAFAQDVVAVPAAHLNHAEGTVAYAPQGEREWQDVQPRRLLKRGDRLWTDRGSRAEVQAGGHALRLDGQTQLVLENVGDAATQLSITQGSIVATVSGLHPGDSFEVGTPNLAFRARQPGDYRIDVDRGKGLTRVVVLSGAGVVFGEKGEALEMRTGQRLTFRQRDLTRMQQPAFAVTDDFDRWAGARRRGEPTVSMPALARSDVAPPPHTERVSSGPDIVIAGPASALPGARPAAAAAAAAPVAKAQQIPNVVLTPTVPAAVPLRVAAPAAPAQPDAQAPAKTEADARAKADAQARAKAQADARAKADATARAKADATARAKAEQKRMAQQRADERRRTLAARRDEQRRQAQASREQEQKRVAATRRAEEERRQAQARRAAEEKRLAAARKAEEAQRIAEARRQQLARLQEQARRDEQAAQARREQQARRAEEDRREAQARREDLARREEQVRREEQARREEDYRRRMLAEQARREQERREQEVWLRQQQAPQPVRPPPMGVPFRRVS